MTKGVIIMIVAIVLVNVAVAAVCLYVDRKRKAQKEESQEPEPEPAVEEPAEEPETPAEPKFKVGDFVKHCFYPDETYIVVSIDLAGDYELESIDGVKGKHIAAATEDKISLWTINDAKNGDVLYSDGYAKVIFIFKGVGENGRILFHCDCNASCDGVADFQVAIGDEYFGFKDESDDIRPATNDEKEYLMHAMNDAGYAWDVNNLTVKNTDLEPQNGDPAVLAPKDEEKEEEVGLFDTLTDYFSKIVPIKDGQVKFFLYCAYREAYNQYFHKDSDYDFPVLYKKENFPVIEDYFTDTEYPYPFEVMTSWLFGCILAELVPEKRNEILNKAYNFAGGKLYGWSFDTDPNICRMVAFDIYNLIMPDDKVPEMMDELGSRMISYTKDISECFVDICSFMPPAAGPYLDEYAKRPCGYPVDYNPMLGGNFAEDVVIHSKVCEKYSLDTEDLEMRQATIQAIANKEHKKPHLFGHFRSVTDPKYGPMTFEPVFGLDSIGIEIPDNGEIANLCYDIGKASTDNRKSLLDREYGRRRPGEGKKDGTANDDPRQRVLVNYAIEDGDGHRTGYYEKNGDYIDDQGNHIGDYVEFYQNAVYANSYPSGHSAFIEGVAGALIHIMPDRADRIIIAKNRFANSRAITRFHWWSDTMIGRLIGTMMLPVMKGVENCDLRERFENAKAEYEALKKGTYKPEPTEKVNTSLSYVCGGYGSCHVDAGEQALNHYCNKECDRERHPSMNTSERVEFTIEGGGVTTIDGKTSGVWEAGTNNQLICPAVAEGEERVAKITMRNENGMRVLNYKLSRQGTKDEGAGN